MNTTRPPVNINDTPAADVRVRRHPEGGYWLACPTRLDGQPAVVTYRATKGQNRDSRTAYWVTEAFVRLVHGDGTQYQVYRGCSKCVKNGFTWRAALVVHPEPKGFLLHGDIAVQARYATAN